MVRLQHNTGFATRIRKRKVQPVASRTRLSMFASTSPLSCQSVLRFILDYAKSALCTSRVCRRTALTRQYIGHSSLSAAGDHQTLWNVFGSGSQQAVGKGKTSRCCTGGCSVPTLVRQLDAGRAARQTVNSILRLHQIGDLPSIIRGLLLQSSERRTVPCRLHFNS
jgi:hypothetical protein